MKKLQFTLLLLLAFCIYSCSKSTSEPEGEEPQTEEPEIDDGYGDETLLCSSGFNGDLSDLSLMLGLAADGVSKINLLVPVKKSNESPIISITSEDEEWGTIDFIGQTEFSSTNYNFYRYSLTAEERLPEALASGSVAELTYKISVSDSDGNSMAAPVTISVIRPAVIFAHGLASNYETFTPMLEYISSMGLYIDEALYALDYFATSIDSYATNINVVPEAINKSRQALKDAGYVNEKFTLVGHSMGGILTRLYIQNEASDYPYSDDILKIITIDTPHSGSQLADFALSLGKDDGGALDIFEKMGAIVDLAVESEATKSLNNSDKLAAANALEIPTHIISAHFGTTMDIAGLIKDKEYIFAVVSYLLNAFEQKYIYGDDESDIVVPMSSQLGGIEDTWKSNFITTYSNQWHCSVHTTEQAATDIMELFNTESSDNKAFTTDGFAPLELTYSANNEAVVTMISSRPELASIVDQLIVGLDKDGQIVSVSYDDEGDSSFELEDQESEVTRELYFAKLTSGEISYMVTDSEE